VGNPSSTLPPHQLTSPPKKLGGQDVVGVLGGGVGEGGIGWSKQPNRVELVPIQSFGRRQTLDTYNSTLYTNRAKRPAAR
jgi:hypothetical protein